MLIGVQYYCFKNVPGWETSDGIKEIIIIEGGVRLEHLIDNKDNKLPEFKDEEILIGL